MARRAPLILREREVDEFAGTGIRISLSGNTLHDNVVAGGVRKIVPKPFEIQELFAAIREVLTP